MRLAAIGFTELNAPTTMSLLYCISMLIMTTSVVLSQAETVVNVYASERTCTGASKKNDAIVAFSVGRKAEFSPAKKSIIPMDHVFFNDGGYFNMSTNVFTAPVSGVYEFYFGACGKSGKPLHIDLFVGIQNQHAVATAYNHNSAAYNHASGSVYMKMKKGEQASVRLHGGCIINAQKIPSTHFNGHLIREVA